MKNLLFLFLFIFLFSCGDSHLDDVNSSFSETNEMKTRLKFVDSEEMLKTMSNIKSMSLVNKKSWSDSKMVNSYFSANQLLDATLTYASSELKSILNADLEFQIGDSILWYNNNKLLVLSEEGNISKAEILSLKKNAHNLPVFWEQELKPVPSLEGTPDKNGKQTRLISINGEQKNKYYPMGYVEKAVTPEMKTYFMATNKSFSPSATKIKVVVEFVSKWESFGGSYLQMWEGYYSGVFIIRLFNEVGGQKIEIPDPIVDAEITGGLFYSYMVGRNRSYPNYYEWLEQKMIFPYTAKIDNIMPVFEKRINLKKDCIWDILVAFTGGTLSFRIGTHPDSEGVLVIKDIQL